MTTQTLTLAGFLTARLDEDEAVARDAALATGARVWTDGESLAAGGRGLLSKRYRDEGPHEGTAHIARHDPARVLADVEAKRRIVAKRAELEAHVAAVDPLGMHSEGTDGQFHTFDWCMRQMIDVYQEHPDYAAAVAWYDDAWRP